MSKEIIFNDEDDFYKYCQAHEDRIIVVYDDEIFDVTDFLEDHPGGPDIIEDYNHNDITELFHSAYPHSHTKGALRMLKRYRIGCFKDEEEATQLPPEQTWTYPKVTENRVEYKEDVKLELTKGLVHQIACLNKKQYLHILTNPVELPHFHLFDSGLFELLTKNKWYLIFLVWLCKVAYTTLSKGPKDDLDDDLVDPDVSFWGMLLAFGSGVLLWTFIEYLLQRCFFYNEGYLMENKSTITLHFILYGKHRIAPADNSKALLPFVFSFTILALFYFILFTLSQTIGEIIFAGLVVGYTYYEFLHCHLHSGTSSLDYVKAMQKYHTNHHNGKGKRGYGVTCTLWDKVFGSETD